MRLRRDFSRSRPAPRPKRRRSRRRRFIVLVVFVLVLLAAGRFVFRIQNIEIQGTQKLSAQTIKDFSNDFLVGHTWLTRPSLMSLAPTRLASALSKEYPFTKFGIQRVFPSTLRITVQEDSAALLWVSGQQRVYLNDAGIAVAWLKPGFSEVSAKEQTGQTSVVRLVEQPGVFTVVATSGQTLHLGDQITDRNFISFLKTVVSLVNKKIGVEVASASVEQLQAEAVSLQTVEGWKIILKSSQPAQDQIDRLAVLLRSQVPNRSKLEYVDLRFGDKIFYK